MKLLALSRFWISLAILIAFVPALVPLGIALDHASYATLGRDQGIFQYIGWALSQGEVDYRDIRDVNGPLIHFVHRVFLALGGGDEVRFHHLDFAVSAIAFFASGALLPLLSATPIVAKKARRRSSLPAPPVPSPALPWATSVVFGLLAVAVLFGQYVRYIFWDLAQRESFCDWFLLPSVVLGVLAIHPLRKKRTAERLAVAAGVLLGIAIFGKPTVVLFGLVSAAGLLFAPRGRKTRLLAGYLLGSLLAAALFTTYLAFFADLKTFLATYFVDAPRIYRFIYLRPWREMFTVPWGEFQHVQAAITLGIGILLMTVRALSPRVFPILLFPVVGYASVILQGKGFPYHFHPISLGLAFAWLTIASGLVEAVAMAIAQHRFVRPTTGYEVSRQAFGDKALAFVMVGLLALGVAAFSRETHRRAETSSYRAADWMAELGKDNRETRDFYDRFRIPDFFPWDLRQAALFVRQHTATDARVQTYGMDPYVLFFAKRLSASPFIYAYDLNYDTAIWGAVEALDGDEQHDRIAWIREQRDLHENELLRSLESRKVEAFVFFDKAPLLTNQDAVDDFKEHSPKAFAWFTTRFALAKSFGDVHVWLRRDALHLAPGELEPVERDEAPTPRDER